MSAASSDRPRVLGAVVDDMTRCVHYRGPTDIIAIRFACCDEYYPCHLCHSQAADHPARQWPADQHDREAILCGACGHELTISTYFAATACPQCHAPFNEGCVLHREHYFEPDAGERRTSPAS